MPVLLSVALLGGMTLWFCLLFFGLSWVLP